MVKIETKRLGKDGKPLEFEIRDLRSSKNPYLYKHTCEEDINGYCYHCGRDMLLDATR